MRACMLYIEISPVDFGVLVVISKINVLKYFQMLFSFPTPLFS